MYKYAYKFGGIVFKYLIEGGGGGGKVGGSLRSIENRKTTLKTTQNRKTALDFDHN